MGVSGNFDVFYYNFERAEWKTLRDYCGRSDTITSVFKDYVIIYLKIL